MMIFHALLRIVRIWNIYSPSCYHKRVTVKIRCSRGAESARARLPIQKSCASPASVEPHDIALARRADIKDCKSFCIGILFQMQPCSSYISPQLRSHSSVPTRRKAGSDLVVNKKSVRQGKANRARTRYDPCRPHRCTYRGGRIVYDGPQIDLLRN